MRWWLLGLGLVVAVSVGLALFHGRRATVGEELLRGLDESGRLRGAIELIDFVPEAASRSEHRWQVGEGPLPGRELHAPQGSFWLEGEGVLLTWRVGRDAGASVRTNLEDATSKRSAKRIRKALERYQSEAVEKWIADARRDWSAMGDEALLMEWLAADRARLAACTSEESALRQAMLLCAGEEEAKNPGPIVVFKEGVGRVYLLPLPAVGGAFRLQMEGYGPGGELAFAGVLRVEAPADPARVRRIAADAAAIAFSRRPTTAPAATP